MSNAAAEVSCLCGGFCPENLQQRFIHFYVNHCGFHIVEFWNKHQHDSPIPEEEVGNWSEDDEMFVFRKVISDKL